MDPNEAYYYAITGMKWLGVGLGALASYFVAIYGTNVACVYLSKNIKSEEELKGAVEEEAEKLGLGGIKISARLDDRSEATADKLTPKYWRIDIGHRVSTCAVVRHELYHVKLNGPKNISALRYWLNEEPRASVYAAFRLRI